MSGKDGSCCLGTYTCVATNCMGSVTSSAALLGFEARVCFFQSTRCDATSHIVYTMLFLPFLFLAIKYAYNLTHINLHNFLRIITTLVHLTPYHGQTLQICFVTQCKSLFLILSGYSI